MLVSSELKKFSPSFVDANIVIMKKENRSIQLNLGSKNQNGIDTTACVIALIK